MVKWSDIDAKCDGFRAGFVAVFREHEGETTDAYDAQGRPMKVSQRTFAEHIGISKSMFHRWLNETKRGVRSAGGTPAQTRSGQMGRQIAKSPKVAVDDKVGMLQDLLSDKRVVRAYREQREPAVTTADAKAAQSLARAIVEPVAQASAELQVPMWVDQLRDIARAISEWELTEAQVLQLNRAARKIVDELEVQKFRLGLETVE